MQKLISIVIPAYNEEKNIPLIYNKLIKVFEGLKKYDFEIIFVDDRSRDKTLKVITKLAQADSKVKYLSFSRNFGKEIATSAGIKHAKGAALIMIDADLQHPPEAIPEFLSKWEKGIEIVIGVRVGNQSQGLIKKIGSFMFYKILKYISETKIKPWATDFRLIDKVVANEFNKFTEKNRITRGLIDWLGFQKDYVYFIVQKRESGQPRYSTLKLIKLALSGFIAHSLFPLKITGYLGIIIILFSGPLGVFIFIEKYILNDPWNLNFSGPAMLAVFILFLIGIVLACLGLIALYIGNIHQEVTDRPLYVIKSKGNID